jgi:hypothetical protein
LTAMRCVLPCASGQVRRWLFIETTIISKSCWSRGD